jgi:hypothetical protein
MKSPAGTLLFSGNDRTGHEIPIMFEITLSLYEAIPQIHPNSGIGIIDSYPCRGH